MTTSTGTAPSHRRDIDGLRAIAVLAVILFHYGYLPRGFLGVDVFFVISGYLITGIIRRELDDHRFSMVNFYLRRIRRIIPLAIVVSGVALGIGMFTMLPDDMENLAQSVIASNFFANNILQDITTRNYWDVVNDYKPLMHTWSLGVEEQYYFFYPAILWLIGSRRPGWILPAIAVLAAVSLALFYAPFQDHTKFYHLPFRFYELAAGGAAAILFDGRRLHSRYSPVFVALLVALLCVGVPGLSHESTLVLTVIAAVGLVIMRNSDNRVSSWLLENRVMVGIGLISYSLYMWHQVLISYARYAVIEDLRPVHHVVVFSSTVLLSVVSYVLIENPFRDRKRVGTRRLLVTVAGLYVVICGAALYVYLHAGVLRDIPELDIVSSQNSRGLHAQYNERVRDFDRPFASANKVKVLVIGNSFARDWVNVLLESDSRDAIEVSYIEHVESHPDLRARASEAHVIFYPTSPDPEFVKQQGIDLSKVYAVGTKSFGKSNGIFYNHRGADYFHQRTRPELGVIEDNRQSRDVWAGRYFDYLDRVLDGQDTVPVFTPSGKFISQDCRHLTKAGAQYFGELFADQLRQLFSKISLARAPV